MKYSFKYGFIALLTMLVLSGCQMGKDTSETVLEAAATLHMVSQNAYDQAEYPDELWNLTKDEGPVFGNLNTMEEIMAIFSDYDQEEGILSIVRLDQYVEVDLNNHLIKMDGKSYSSEGRVMIIEGEPWLALDYFDELFALEIRKDTANKQMLVKDRSRIITVTEVAASTDLLTISEGEWVVMDTLKKSESVLVLDEADGLTEVFTDAFKHGYLDASYLGDFVEQPVEKRPYVSNYQQEAKQIFLAWDQNYQKNPTDEVYGSIEYVNVLSPTWLNYKNKEGELQNRISSDYLKWAETRGIDVWVLVTNDFDPELTHELINNASARKKAISNVVEALKEHSVKGLNIDFENIYKDDKNKLVQFVAELTAACHAEDIVVSMDVTMMGGSDNWSLCYDREKLGQIVDYMVIMAYDQHWASSPVSGTVAGINWVEEGLNAFLEMVPHDKIVLGMPLYTRVWRETPSAQVVNAMDVKSKAITMAASQRIIDEKELKPIWDNSSGQYYVAYIEDQTLYKIWHEDFKSLSLKAALVKGYDLGGAAVWRRGYEAPGTWEVIDKAMKE